MTCCGHRNRLLFWIVALLGLAADLGTKAWAYARVGEGERTDPIPGLLKVTPVPMDRLNKGAIGGVGKEFAYSNEVYAAISALAAAAIIIWSFRKSFAASLYLCIAVGFILAGAAGNLYDRLVHQGVRDFLQLHWQDETQLSYIFNLADSCLIVGAAMLVLQAIFARAEPEPASAPPPAAPVEPTA